VREHGLSAASGASSAANDILIQRLIAGTEPRIGRKA
jgi:hypothetical protein